MKSSAAEPARHASNPHTRTSTTRVPGWRPRWKSEGAWHHPPPHAFDPWIALFLLLTGGTVAVAFGFAALRGFGLPDAFAGPTLDHWRAVLVDRGFWTALGFSLALTLATLALCLVSALSLALALGQQLRRPPLAFAIYLPLAVPGVVAALVSYQLLGSAGLFARLAHAAGWIDAPDEFPALVFDRHGLGILITHWAMVTPFFVILLHRLLDHERIPALREQAHALGASRWQSLRRVALPLLARGALPLCAVYGAVLLAAFEVPLAIGARYPNMISLEIHDRINGVDLALRPRGFAMAALYLLLLTATWWVAGRWWRRRGAMR